ncbi:MAG: prepilin-type N-terminal cleavage/methylation domain-containing protein [Gemmatimonadota bacterium]
MNAPRPSRDGFTIIELVIALAVLSIGLLAMASVMGTLVMQTRASDIRTERAFAVQQTVERLRAVSLSTIDDRAEADAMSVGSYAVWWSTADATSLKRQMEIFTKGPGFVPGDGFMDAKLDTFRVTLARID